MVWLLWDNGKNKFPEIRESKNTGLMPVFFCRNSAFKVQEIHLAITRSFLRLNEKCDPVHEK